MNIKVWLNALLFNIYPLYCSLSSILIAYILQTGGLFGILIGISLPIFLGMLAVTLILTTVFIRVIVKKDFTFKFSALLPQKFQPIKNIFRYIVYVLSLFYIIFTTYDYVNVGIDSIRHFSYSLGYSITALFSFIGFAIFTLNVCNKKVQGIN